jgi:plastocyanin
MKNLLIIIGLVIIIVLGYYGYKSIYKPLPMSVVPVSSTAVATTQIEIKNFAFSPNNASLSVGQELTFINNDSVTHNVVADDNSFTSGPLASGQTFKKVFSTAGVITYHCSIHPSMTGRIEIK